MTVNERGLVEGKKLKCGHKAKYSEKYDAYYCEECNHWVEGSCSDPNCEYCTPRPIRPREK